jgi:hypothetical protein
MPLEMGGEMGQPTQSPIALFQIFITLRYAREYARFPETLKICKVD